MLAADVRKLLETAQESESKTITEGLETSDAPARVKNRGADFVEGYYLACPALPLVSIFRAFLRQKHFLLRAGNGISC